MSFCVWLVEGERWELRLTSRVENLKLSVGPNFAEYERKLLCKDRRLKQSGVKGEKSTRARNLSSWG